MAEYEAGEAFLRILPSFNGVVEEINRRAAQWGASAGSSFSRTFNDTVRRETDRTPLGPSDDETRRRGVGAGGKFAEGFESSLRAAMRALPDIEINADTSDADAHLAGLRAQMDELSRKRVGVDIDETEALAQIEALKTELARLAAESPSAEVRVNTAAAVAQLEAFRVQVARAGQAAAGSFADAFRARFTAAMQALPDVRINADSSEADIKLAELRARLATLAEKRIGIDIDEAEALSKLAELRAELDALGKNSDSIRVRMDTAAASAQLAALRAQIDETKAKADGLGSVESISLDVVTGPAMAAIGMIQTALLGLSAAAVITPVIAGATAMLGPAAALLGGVGGVGLASIPAISAVSKARQAQQAAAAATTGGSGGAAQDVNRDNAVRGAEMSLADARRRASQDQVTSAQQVRQANQQLRQAELSLTQAQTAAKDAQNALADAREQARRGLVDSANSVADAQLSLQQDQIALIEAQQNYQSVMVNASATDLQRQQAALQLHQAQQALVEQQITVSRATEDNTKAQKAGVEGSAQVVTAQTNIAAANQKVVDAHRGVQQAEQGLATARRQRRDQQITDQEAITRSEMALQGAQAQSASSTSGAASAADKYAAALAALTPQEQRLLSATQGFSTAFKDFGRALEPAVIPVLTAAMRDFGRLLPEIEPLVRATAHALGDMLDRLDKVFRGSAFKEFLSTLTRMIGPTISTLTTFVINIGTAFANIVEAFAPLSAVVLQGLAQLAGMFADAAKSPGIRSFVATMTAIAPTVIDAFASIGGLIGTALNMLAPLAEPALQLLSTLARAAQRVLGAIGAPLQGAFLQLQPILSDLITRLVPPLTAFLTSVIGSLPALGQALADVVTALLPLLPVLAAIIRAAGPIISFLAPLAPYIFGLVAAIRLVIEVVKIWTAVQTLLNLVMDANPIALVIIAIAAFVAGIILAYNHSKTFRDIVQQAWKVVKEAIAVAWRDVIKPILELLALQFDIARTAVVKSFDGIKAAWRDTAKWLANAWSDFTGTVSNWWGKIAHGVTSAFGGIKRFFTGLWSDVQGIFRNGVNWIIDHVLNPVVGVLNGVLGVFGVHIKKVGDIGSGGGGGGGGGGGSSSSQGVGGGVYAAASGGILPGWTPGRDVYEFANPALGRLRLSGGEAIMRPEWVAAVGPDYVHAANAAARTGGAGGVRSLGGFASGGIIGDIGGWLSSGEKRVVGLLRSGSANAAVAALHGLEAPYRALTGPVPFVHQWVNGLLDTLNKKVDAYIRGHAAAVAGHFGGSAGIGGAGVRAIWDNLRAQGFNAIQAAGVMGNMQSESGFNPFIIQGGGTSTNPADAGGGGYGLVQWTPGAKLIPYLQGAAPSVASEVRALAEQLSGHGSSPEGAAGHALAGARTPSDAATLFGLLYERYAGGVQSNRAAQAEAIYDQYKRYDAGGYLPPGISAVLNGTGHPEPVFTSQQWATLKTVAGKSLANGSAQGGQFTGNLYLSSGELLGVVQGVVDSSFDDLYTQAVRQ